MLLVMEFVSTLHIVSHFYCKNARNLKKKSFLFFSHSSIWDIFIMLLFQINCFSPKSISVCCVTGLTWRTPGPQGPHLGHRIRGLAETTHFLKPHHFTTSFLCVFSRYIFFVFIHRMLYIGHLKSCWLACKPSISIQHNLPLCPSCDILLNLYSESRVRKGLMV